MDQFLVVLSDILKWLSFESVMAQIEKSRKRKQSNEILAFLVELYNLLNRIVFRSRSIQQHAMSILSDPRDLQSRSFLLGEIFEQLIEIEVIIDLVAYDTMSFFVDKNAFDDTYFLKSISGKKRLLDMILMVTQNDLLYKRVLQNPEYLNENHLRKYEYYFSGLPRRLFSDNPFDFKNFDIQQFRILADRLNGEEANAAISKIAESRDDIKKFIEQNFSIFDVMSSMEHNTLSFYAYKVRKRELMFYDFLENEQRPAQELSNDTDL